MPRIHFMLLQFMSLTQRVYATIIFSSILRFVYCAVKLSGPMSVRKLKILCLHGKQQNKEIFRTKLGRIPHKLKHFAELTVIDAPFILEELSTPEVSARTWFYREPEINEINTESLKSSISMLQQTWFESGPFDGVLGFSMGGTMAAVMSASVLPSQPDGITVEPIENDEQLFPGLKFVICAGAVDIPAYLEAAIPTVGLPLRYPLTVPERIQSLHIAGKADTSVPIESSVALASRFKEALFVEHEQGHHIPMKAVVLQAIVDFVSKQELSN